MAALSVQTGVGLAAVTHELPQGQAAQLVQTYLAERATRVTQQAADRAGQPLTSVPTSDAMRQRLQAEAAMLDDVRRWTRSAPIRGYVKAEVSVAIDALAATGPNSYKVSATERTNLYFGHGDPTAPQFEGYRLRHEFTFLDESGIWTLVDTTPESHPGPPVPTQVQNGNTKWLNNTSTVPAATPGAPVAASALSAVDAGAKAPAGVIDKLSPASSLDYDYQAMYNYALRYWYYYNPAYRTFSNDCTNFISQIMRAGGWQDDLGYYWDNSNWWYNSLNQTYSWAGAHNWALFAQVYSRRTAPLAYVYQMLVTDVLQVDWDHPDEDPSEPANNIDHTMFVDGIQGTPGAATEIFLTYHTIDRQNAPFWSWLLPQTESRDVWYAHRT